MFNTFKSVLFFTMILFFMGCTYHDKDFIPELTENRYEPLPENLIAFNDDRSVSARYVDPTLRYDHGILGDKIEAGGMLVIKNKKEYHYKLDEAFVYEDLRPRLKDVDNDGELEFITILTSLNSGAGVCVYKILNGSLRPIAQSGYIGMTHRWLNIAAVDDLDNDGKVEIAWIQTPHIGGILKIARIVKDSLLVLDEKEGVSNHQIGSRNLCLSVVTAHDGSKKLYVPNNPHHAIMGFSFRNDRLIAEDTILLNIDPIVPLFMQYNFEHLSEDKNCIYIPAGRLSTENFRGIIRGRLNLDKPG